MFTPVNPSFTIQKWVLKGSELYRRVFVKWSIYLWRRTAADIPELPLLTKIFEEHLFIYLFTYFHFFFFFFFSKILSMPTDVFWSLGLRTVHIFLMIKFFSSMYHHMPPTPTPPFITYSAALNQSYWRKVQIIVHMSKHVLAQVLGRE